MYKILGKHSIVAAYLNIQRKEKIFYGRKETYSMLNLQCKFIEHKNDFLSVKELFINATIENVIKKKRVIVLDGIIDPRNIGAIVRSAAILSYGVIIRNNCGAISETTVKCASGGFDITPVALVNNFFQLMSFFRENAWHFFALDENGKKVFNKVKDSFLLIIGSEEKGISAKLKEYCQVIQLIGSNTFKTYNCSVAASIAMYNMIY